MKRPFKIALLAPYPAFALLPHHHIKKRKIKAAKLQHPAPWISALCQHLSSSDNVEIKVFTHNRDIKGVRKVKNGSVEYTFLPKYEPRRLDPYHLFLPARIQFAPHIRRFNPDIVHGFGTENVYGFLAAQQKRPNVVFIQGIQEKLAPFTDKSRLKSLIHRMIERYVISKTDGIITETQFAHEWAQSHHPKGKIINIPHAAKDYFSGGSPSFESRKIICVGRLSRIKGCDTVLKAFKIGIESNPDLFRNAELDFIGEGPLAGRLKALASDYGINENVNFYGRIDHKEMPGIMRSACMLVIGSRMDTSPNVITEAHFTGIPVIGTNAGGIPDMIIDGKDGFVVPIDDGYRMSKKMELLLNNIGLCSILGQNGRDKVKELNNPIRIASAHLSFYKEIINRHPR